MPEFKLLFTLDCKLDAFTLFIIYKHMHTVFLCKSLDKIVFMLVHTPGKIICNSDIECAVTFACQYVDAITLQGLFWILAFARMTPKISFGNGYYLAFKTSCCTWNSCRMPFSASDSKSSIACLLKGLPSAVPCTSTNSPLLVITTLKSTSAWKSSS